MASRVGVNLRASAYLHQGDRKYMEDEFQVAYQRTHDKKDIEYAFFGIFDGHGGKEAAHFAKDNLMDNIVSQHSFWSENDEDVLCAIKEGFLQTHMAMWKELDQWPKTASGWPSTSGTTASVAFIRKQKIYIGHVGDSGIVLGYEHGNSEWDGVSLTRDHKPESLLEMNRITECGGKVIAKSGVPRVVWNRPKSGHQGPVRRSTPMDEIPFLAVARSLGDLWSYNATNDQFVVSPEPDVCVIDIDINHHRCLVFGTDGLWNALSPSTAVNIAYNSEKNNEKHYLGIPLGCGKQRLWINPSRCIVTGALERYMRVSLRADNTSAVTVYLDPPGRPKREVLLQQVSLKKGANSPSKAGSPKSPSKRLKEASVKVHVYNQTNQAWSGEGNRSLLCIKERLPEGGPEGGQDGQNGDTGASCSNSYDDSGNTSSTNCSRTTDTDHLYGLRDSNSHDRSRKCSQKNFHLGSDGSYNICSECGCGNHGNSPQSSHRHLNVSSGTISESHKKTVPDSTSDYGKGDDIQIPLVSSSTFVDSSTTEVDKVPKVTSSAENVSNAITSPPKRRTRSSRNSAHLENRNSTHSENRNSAQSENRNSAHSENRNSTHSENRNSAHSENRNSAHLEKSENMKISGHSKVTKNIHPSHESDASLRVLKSVNRGAACLNVSSSSAPAFSMSSKRKRAKEEEPTNKSIRVHTRSRTLSVKPMITRSQGKSFSKRNK